MTTTLLTPASAVLRPDGGFVLPVNCPACGGGLTVEGTSRGRDDMAAACLEVRVVLFCAHCRDRFLLAAQLDIATRQRVPEKRWTGKVRQ